MRRKVRRTAVSEEYPENDAAREAGEKSERLLQDTYLSGAVGMGVAGPRLSADLLARAEDGAGQVLVHEDRSWKTHAEEEGDQAAEAAACSAVDRPYARRAGRRPPRPGRLPP